MVKKLLATSFVAVLALLGLTAAPAQAAWTQCHVGEFCLFDGYTGTGALRIFAVPPGPTCFNLSPSGWANRANSAYNRTGQTVNVYPNPCNVVESGSAINHNGAPNFPICYPQCVGVNDAESVII